MAIITPYDQRIALWHHQGQKVGAQSIDEFAQGLRRAVPAATQVFVKTSDGSTWMSRYDHKTALAINGPEAIRRWVLALQRYGLEFHAWCVPRGLDINAEAQLIIEACSVPGVRSMILDVEPYQGFYQGARDTIRPLMMKIRSALPAAFHIGMTVDPRPQHYHEIFPEEWFPFINSIHLQVYWRTFGVSPDRALAQAFTAWRNFGRPLFPVLQGHTSTAEEVDQARRLSVETYQAPGISWWVLGDIQPHELVPINRSLTGDLVSPPPGLDGQAVTYGASIIVHPGDPGYAGDVFAGAEPHAGRFGLYPGYGGYMGKYHPTNDHVANVWARWDPQLRRSGWYNIEAYVPNLHATTGKARYKLHGVAGEASEYLITLPQMLYSNEWAPLGTYFIDVQKHQPGVIYLTDWTFENGREITFDAIRWRAVIEPATLQVIGDISLTANEIFRRGQQLGNRAGVFSRVGDSITFSPHFLTPLGQGRYDLGPYRTLLEPVVQHFSRENARTANAFANQPLAAGNGWGADRLLQSGYANVDTCGAESPLVCEYKRVRPAIALIMIGTNDSGGVAPDVYTANLRRIVDISIEMGVIPVLSTIPPKRVDSWHTARVTEWNNIIRSLAQHYEVPLWDYWFAVQNLPNQGLSSDGIHPSAPPDGLTAHFSTTNLQYGYTMRNLTALQMLQTVWLTAMR